MPIRARINEHAAVELPSMSAAARWTAWRESHKGAEIIIDEFKPTRSLSQNRYYWAYLGIIANETGDDAQSLHELFKRQLLPPRFIKVRGIELKIPGSTKDLDKLEFTQYLDKIAALTNIPLPDPAEAGYISNY